MIGAAGAAKLAGAQFTKENFARWGYPDPWRPAIGAVEVATALLAVAGLKSDLARKAAGVGALSSMGGAIATHTIAGEPAYNLIPPFVVAGLGVAAVYDLSLTRKV